MRPPCDLFQGFASAIHRGHRSQQHQTLVAIAWGILQGIAVLWFLGDFAYDNPQIRMPWQNDLTFVALLLQMPENSCLPQLDQFPQNDYDNLQPTIYNPFSLNIRQQGILPIRLTNYSVP